MLKAGALADRVFCRYSELSVNTCENRLIKRALLFAERIVGRMLDHGHRSAVMLQGRLNGCLAAFAEVDDRVELWEVRRNKRNKLYREYEEAVKLAKIILRRYDNSIDRASAEKHTIPAFGIDMSLLYEHYVLGALRKAYGPKILYQANVATGKPDFLYVDEARPLILDTKYKPRYGAGRFDVEDIRQLAGYARDRKALKKLGIQETEEQSSAVVPCVIIFPEVWGGDVKFDGSRSPIDQVELEVAPLGELAGFYRMGFPLPVLSAGVAVAGRPSYQAIHGQAVQLLRVSGEGRASHEHGTANADTHPPIFGIVRRGRGFDSQSIL